MPIRSIAFLAAFFATISASARETLDEAWWTGPLLAAGAGTLPGSAGCFGEQAIAGGFLNTATGDLSSISGGQQNTVSGISATVIGCSHITLTGDYKTNNTCP